MSTNAVTDLFTPVSFPHYFLQATGSLAEQLKTREWLVARITSILERVVEPNVRKNCSLIIIAFCASLILAPLSYRTPRATLMASEMVSSITCCRLRTGSSPILPRRRLVLEPSRRWQVQGKIRESPRNRRRWTGTSSPRCRGVSYRAPRSCTVLWRVQRDVHKKINKAISGRVEALCDSDCAIMACGVR
jgi:hypothetical protein